MKRGGFFFNTLYLGGIMRKLTKDVQKIGLNHHFYMGQTIFLLAFIVLDIWGGGFDCCSHFQEGVHILSRGFKGSQGLAPFVQKVEGPPPSGCFSQAHPQPSLQLFWAEIALISQLTGNPYPTLHHPTTQDSSFALLHLSHYT